MKNLIYFIAPIVLVLAWSYFSTSNGPIYKSNSRTIFSNRVTSFINNKVSHYCDTKNNQFFIVSEQLEIKSDRYSFSGILKLKNNSTKSGFLKLDELNSGKINLTNITCPGKDGSWITYSSEDKGRFKASVNK